MYVFVNIKIVQKYTVVTAKYNILYFLFLLNNFYNT